MTESKLGLYRHIIKGGALLLIVFFFVLPLIQCAAPGQSGLNASGWEIATGTGDLFSEAEDEGANPFVFLLLLIPVALLALAFTKKSFAMLAIFPVAGLVVKIIFMIVAQSRVAGTDGLFELTGLNWLVLLLYAGLCVFTFYCAKLAKNSDS